MLPVAILAGGLATRLRPITEKIPKALVEVAGQPFICRQLEYLREQGVQRVALCIGYLGEMIEDEVRNGSRFGLEVRYSPDGPQLLGTGGALMQALPLLGEEFLVLYGDSFLPIDFGAVARAFQSSRKQALMTILRNDNRWDKSNVLFRDGQLIEYNKRAPRTEMAHIDYGLGAVKSDVFADYTTGEPFDLSDVYHALSLRGQLAGYEVHQRFYEIGTYGGLKETEEYFFTKEKT